MSVEMLLNVLQAIAPLKHYSRLREIIGVKLPPGFPVQIGTGSSKVKLSFFFICLFSFEIFSAFSYLI